MTAIGLRDDLDPGIPGFFKQPNTIVRRSVVDKDHLVRNPGPLEDRLPVTKKRFKVLLFVVHGNYDDQCRIFRHELTAFVEECPSRKYPVPGRSSGAYHNICNLPGVR